jgi:hypothetical protein
MFGFHKKEREELTDLNMKMEIAWEEMLKSDIWLSMHNEDDPHYMDTLRRRSFYRDLHKSLMENRNNLLGCLIGQEDSMKTMVKAECLKAGINGAFQVGFVGLSQYVSDNGRLPVVGSIKELTTSYIRKPR